MLKFFAAGGAAASVAASTCCVLPLILGAVGISGALVSELGVFAPYQSAFRIAAVTLLAAGFWQAYVRSPTHDSGAACAPRRTSRWVKPILWAAALLLAVVFGEPVWGRWIG